MKWIDITFYASGNRAIINDHGLVFVETFADKAENPSKTKVFNINNPVETHVLNESLDEIKLKFSLT